MMCASMYCELIRACAFANVIYKFIKSIKGHKIAYAFLT